MILQRLLELLNFRTSDDVLEEHLGKDGVGRKGGSSVVSVEGGEDSRSGGSGGSEDGTGYGGGAAERKISGGGEMRRLAGELETKGGETRRGCGRKNEQSLQPLLLSKVRHPRELVVSQSSFVKLSSKVVESSLPHRIPKRTRCQ